MSRGDLHEFRPIVSEAIFWHNFFRSISTSGRSCGQSGGGTDPQNNRSHWAASGLLAGSWGHNNRCARSSSAPLQKQPPCGYMGLCVHRSARIRSCGVTGSRWCLFALSCCAPLCYLCFFCLPFVTSRLISRCMRWSRASGLATFLIWTFVRSL